MIHRIVPGLLSRPVSVELVGCGGTGSVVFTHLARLHHSMLSLGHPFGLRVLAFDPDVVTEANVGRQLFYAADVGKNKAEVLVDRLNFCYGLDWRSRSRHFHQAGTSDIVISCVDSRKSRRSVRDVIKGSPHVKYHIDCGNGASTGQVVIGCATDPKLPMPYVAYPQLVKAGKEDDTPSCSLAEALEHQELFINPVMAVHACQLLWTLFRHGGLDHRGVFVDLANGITKPIPIP
jgi:PRTRC genetic system ThiF family protein